MFKDNKKSASLVLTTLAAGMLASPRSEVYAAWYDFLWYLMPTFLWNRIFGVTFDEKEGRRKVSNVEIGQSNDGAGEEGKLSAKETEIKNEYKERVCSILQGLGRSINNLSKELSKEGVIYFHKTAVPEEGYTATYNVTVPVNGYEDPINFLRVGVTNDGVRLYRFIDRWEERSRKQKEKSFLEEDTFKEISLTSEGDLHEVEKFAEEVLGIFKVFHQLFKICRQLRCGGILGKQGKRNIAIESRFGCISFGERYVKRIVICEKMEKIKVFYCSSKGSEYELSEDLCKEYNVLKSEDREALTKLFSESNVILYKGDEAPREQKVHKIYE